MAKLLAKPPLDFPAPLTICAVTLSMHDTGPMTSIAPYPGAGDALAKALKSAHGLGFPAPNRVTRGQNEQLIWAGRDLAFLVGVAPDPALAGHAALTDQGDGWVTFRLDGAAVPAVLARLTPLDLRPAQFGVGHAARSELSHMMAVFTRPAAATIDVMVFRSMAATAFHKIEEAMKSVAAQG